MDEVEDEDAVDGWRDPNDTFTGGQLLSKYDDVEEMAMKKKMAGRMTIGESSKAPGSQGANKNSQSKDLAIGGESFLTKRSIGSDYYAANEEDPLAGVSKSFKKAKAAGSKRTRMSAMSLVDNEAAVNDEEDIVSALEASAKSNGFGHLSTKQARNDKVKAAEASEAVQVVEKRANFQRAFDKVQMRNRAKKESNEKKDDMFDMTEQSEVQDDDYALIEHQLEKQRKQDALRKQGKTRLTGEDFL